MSTKLPPALIRSLIEQFNIEEEDFVKSHDNERLTSIRLNPFKPTDIFMDAERVPWSENGRYLKTRPSFTADPFFHAGCYYVQEASSMFIEHILKDTLDLDSVLRVLDLCASPGGKSTLVSSLLNKDSVLVANEIIKTRVPVLTDNLTKWGPENTFVTNNDPADFKRLGAYFDAMVIDAPCSGSGMFRKDADAINEWSESAVELCSQRQQRILADVYPALKEDGVLVYSTCSYSKKENEDICDWLAETFGMRSVQIPIDETWGVVETRSDRTSSYGYRFYPHKVRGEGFFVACLIKTQAEPEAQIRRGRENKIKPKEIQILHQWLKNPEEFRITNLNEDYFALRESHIADLQFLQSHLYLKKSGVRLGKIMGKDLVPNHELALSLILNQDIRRVNLNQDQAISYLKRDEFKLEENGLLGWALMCFEGHPLGWAKLLPMRLNNYFPKENRIFNKNVG